MKRKREGRKNKPACDEATAYETFTHNRAVRWWRKRFGAEFPYSSARERVMEANVWTLSPIGWALINWWAPATTRFLHPDRSTCAPSAFHRTTYIGAQREGSAAGNLGPTAPGCGLGPCMMMRLRVHEYRFRVLDEELRRKKVYPSSAFQNKWYNVIKQMRRH